MSSKAYKSITFRGYTYKRVEAQQTEPVYLGTVYAGESAPQPGGGTDVGPTTPVVLLAARNLDALKSTLHKTEESFLQDLAKSPTEWNIRLFTNIKPQDFHEFQHKVRQEWTNAEQIIRDLVLGRVVVLENVIEDAFQVMR